MTKPKRTKDSGPPKPAGPNLGRVHVNIHGEINQIIRRAKERDARVVSVGPLIFFSTETGDAWLLDSDDGLALCLAQEGVAQRIHLTETPSDFGIEWTASYRIQGEDFVVSERPDRVRTIPGYPTKEILRLAPKWG